MSDRILRLQHVEVRTPDLELCAAYYTEVLGLLETCLLYTSDAADE